MMVYIFFSELGYKDPTLATMLC